MRGGTYLVTRRIRMLIEVWDRASLDDQEQTIGRRKESGAPLGGSASRRGRPRVEAVWRADVPSTRTSASPRRPRTADRAHPPPRATRSPTAWTRELGQLDAGLFFISFQSDPASVRRAPAAPRRASDALNEYIKHTGSALFACPPGVRPGGYVGETLLG